MQILTPSTPQPQISLYRCFLPEKKTSKPSQTPDEIPQITKCNLYIFAINFWRRAGKKMKINFFLLHF